MKTTIKDRLKANEAVHGCWINMGSPISTEIVGAAGFDWVLLDLEHGTGTEPSLINQLQALKGSEATPIVPPGRSNCAQEFDYKIKPLLAVEPLSG